MEGKRSAVERTPARGRLGTHSPGTLPGRHWCSYGKAFFTMDRTWFRAYVVIERNPFVIDP